MNVSFSFPASVYIYLLAGLALGRFCQSRATDLESGYWDNRNSRSDRIQPEFLGIDADGNLLAAGSMMQMVNQVESSQLARWGGQRWTMLTNRTPTSVAVHEQTTWLAGIPAANSIVGFRSNAAPVSLSPVVGSIGALASTDRGLVAGGNFIAGIQGGATNVAIWSEGDWRALGAGLAEPVVRLLSTSEGLFAATATSVWRWDGVTWTSLQLPPTRGPASVRAFSWYAGRLVVGVNTGDVTDLAVWTWSGQQWEPLSATRIPGFALALATFQGDLYAAGQFEPFDGSPVRCGLVKLTQGVWVPVLLPGGYLHGNGKLLVATATELFAVTGLRTQLGLGAAGSFGFWQFDAGGWSHFSNGLQLIGRLDYLADSRAGVVLASRSGLEGSTPGRHGWLHDGRYLKSLGVAPVPDVTLRLNYLLARRPSGVLRPATLAPASNTGATVLTELQGTNWTVITSPCAIDPMALGTHGEAIILAGYDTSAGVAEVVVTEWRDGEWKRLGGRFTTGESGNAFLNVLLSHRGRLFVGGEFTHVDQQPIAHLAEWDGTRWKSVGEPLDGPVRALAQRGADVLVFGNFAHAGGQEANSLALLTSTGWEDFGHGLPAKAMTCLAVSDDGIVAVGTASTGNGEIWLHRGQAWEHLVATTNNSINGVLWRGHDLFVVGDFTRVNGISGCALAVWHEPGTRLVEFTAASGRFSFRRTGASSSPRSIEYSENLTDWTPWITEPRLSLRDTYDELPPGLPPARFYRERKAP